MLKEAYIVIKPTTDRSKVGINPGRLEKNKFYYFDPVSVNEGQHLYILSKEEPKEGDWLLHLQKKLIRKYDSYIHSERIDEYKTIIASTDSSLSQLPHPSNEFLKAFCKKGGFWEVWIQCEAKWGLFDRGGNQSGPLVNTFIEACELNTCLHGEYAPDYDEQIVNIPKVAADNTITIFKPLKPTYTQEQIEEIIDQYTEFIRFGFSHPIRQSILRKKEEWKTKYL